MFALKQVSLMALLIALAYGAPQLDSEANARNINTEDYINVSFGIIIVQYTISRLFFLTGFLKELP